MGFLNWLSGLFASSPAPPPPAPPAGTRTIDELAARLKVTVGELTSVPIAYQQFEIPKRHKGMRKILAPVQHLKTIQRQILRRVLGGLKPHPCATGFTRGYSIVSNALPHLGKAAIVRMDLKDFFPSTPALRVNHYFRFIGWNAEAADLLTRLCTHNNALPQGAPTSPKLSNLLNHHLDALLFDCTTISVRVPLTEGISQCAQRSNERASTIEADHELKTDCSHVMKLMRKI